MGLIDELAPAQEFVTPDNREQQALMLNKYTAIPYALSNQFNSQPSNMEKKKTSLLDKMKALIAGHEDEAQASAAAPAQAEAETPATAPEAPAVDLDAARQALEAAGWGVTAPAAHPDTVDEDQEDEAEVLALVRDLQSQVQALKAEKAKAAAGPSGGAQKAAQAPAKVTTEQAARNKAFEGFTGTVIKYARNNA